MNGKLHSSRGETLVEVLACILIASLSIALLFGGITASSQIGRRAQEADEAYYEALSEAEVQRTAAAEAQVKVENPASGSVQTLPVRLYGGGGIFSYAFAEGGP